MRNIILIYLFSSLTINLFAQINGIDFIDNPKWSDALAQSGKENKLLFVDCYTTWCEPCKALDKEVFQLKSVGDFMNSKFINVKMNMEKGDGIALAKKYQERIVGYPTMLFINEKGDIVHQLVGYKDEHKLIEAAENVLAGNGVLDMKKRYENGERTYKFMREYIESLREAFQFKEAKILIDNYLNTLPIESLKEKDVIEIYTPFINDIYSARFEFILLNMDYFNKKLEGFNSYLLVEQLNTAMRVAVKDIVSYKMKKDGTYPVADSVSTKIAKIRYYFKKYLFKNQSQHLMRLRIYEIQCNGEYKKAVDYLTVIVDCGVFGGNKNRYLTEYLNFFTNNCKDKELIKQIEELINNELPN